MMLIHMEARVLMMCTRFVNYKVRVRPTRSAPPLSLQAAAHYHRFILPFYPGKFLPTRRTPGISTSDLLARLVSGYRHRVFDKKLAKMGMHALMAEGSDWDESASVSRAESRDVSRRVSRVGSPSLEKVPCGSSRHL